jgi:hypothetical protein
MYNYAATWLNKHPFVLRHPTDDGGPTGYQGIGAGVSDFSYKLILEAVALQVTRIILSLLQINKNAKVDSPSSLCLEGGQLPAAFESVGKRLQLSTRFLI